MKAEITFRQVWYNPSILDFFFRSQSERTLEGLIEKSTLSTTEILEHVEDYAQDNNLELDDIEEMFYEDSVEELASEFGIELEEDEEEE